MQRIETTRTTNGDTNIIDYRGGLSTLFVQGDLSGGDIVTLFFSRNGGSRWTAVQKINAEGTVTCRLTDEGNIDFHLAACQLKATLSAASGASIEISTHPIDRA